MPSPVFDIWSRLVGGKGPSAMPSPVIDLSSSPRFCHDIRLSEDYCCDEGTTTQGTFAWDLLKNRFVGIIPEQVLPGQAPERGTIEFKLSTFEDWYKDRFRFPQILEKLKEESSASNKSAESHYELRVVFYFPDTNNREAVWPPNQTFIKGKIVDFYNSTFKKKDDQESIKSCVTNHPSIVILGTKTSDNDMVHSLCFPTKEITKKSTFVLGALTYMLSEISPDGTVSDPCTMLLWFATAKEGSKAGLFHNSGISLFLLQLLLKRCAVQAKKVDGMPLPPISIFAQVQPEETEGAVPFYQSLGFEVMIDPLMNNGLSHIPNHLSTKFSKSEFIKSKEGKMLLFRFVAGKANGMTNNQVSKLVSSVGSSLPGKNVSSKSDIIDVDDVNDNKVSGNSDIIDVVDDVNDNNTRDLDTGIGKSSIWCSFPPSANMPLMSARDLFILLKDLPLLGNLLPHQGEEAFIEKRDYFPYNGRHFLTGEVKMLDRLKEDEEKGKEWMFTGHICAGLALMMSDERYKQHALIINPYLMKRIENLYEKYLAYSQDLFNQSELEAKPDGEKTEQYSVLLQKSVDACKTSKETFKKLHEPFKHEVLNQEPYKSLMEKRLVMFLVNRKDTHWLATYVFNPGSIDVVISEDNDSDKPQEEKLRCCFFRYCGSNNDGESQIRNSNGIIWFLNQAYCWARRREDGSVPAVSPFGSNDKDDVNLKGTATFPSLKMNDDHSFLPIQYDGYSCGMAIIAGTGILLRDWFWKSGGDNFRALDKFKTLLDYKNTKLEEENGEWFCKIAEGAFRDCPEQKTRTYLDDLKKELYNFFDRVAAFRHVILPARGHTKIYTIEDYETCKKRLSWPPPIEGSTFDINEFSKKCPGTRGVSLQCMLGPKFPKKEWDIEDYVILPTETINWKKMPKVERRSAVTNQDGTLVRNEAGQIEYRMQEVEMSNDEKQYEKMLEILEKSRGTLETEVLSSAKHGCIGDTTCKWCHEHWMGTSGVLLILPDSECNRMKWAKFCSLTPKKLAEVLYKKTGTRRLDTLGKKIERDDHTSTCFWETEQVNSLCHLVMHELHPENVHFYVHCEYYPVENYSFRLDRNSRFIIVVVVEQKEYKHFSTYVFDLENGRCDVMDPVFYEPGTEERSDQEKTHGRVSCH